MSHQQAKWVLRGQPWSFWCQMPCSSSWTVLFCFKRILQLVVVVHTRRVSTLEAEIGGTEWDPRGRKTRGEGEMKRKGRGKERTWNSEERTPPVEFISQYFPATVLEARSLKPKGLTQWGFSCCFRAQENHYRARQNGYTSSGISLLSH